MLCFLDDLIGMWVRATDGKLGRVRDFLFDDQSWLIRYLVVDLRGWFSRRSVIVQVGAADRPDCERGLILVNLSREQVRHCPDANCISPVGRQQEEAMRQYYGWPDYLDMNTLEGAFPSLPAGREFPLQDNYDAHLRDAQDLKGYEVRGHSGVIGQLDYFIMDRNWHIGYLEVKNGGWLKCCYTLLSTQLVESISWARRQVKLSLRRETTGSTHDRWAARIPSTKAA